VTVCVAALCERHTIIAATDRMLTTGDIEHEPEQGKVSWMNPSLAVMVSGDIPLHTEIVTRVYAEVSERIRRKPGDWWSVSDVADLYVKHHSQVRAKRGETVFLAPLGLTLDTFHSRRAEMPQEQVNKITSDLYSIELPFVQAIVAGRDATGAHLWLINPVAASPGAVEATCYDGLGYVSIGMGCGHAESQMIFARHTRHKPFAETLFLTYLAKKRAEVAPGVGSGSTDMFVITNLGQAATIDAETIDNLDKIYRVTKRREAAAFQDAGIKARKYVDRLSSAESKAQWARLSDGLISIELSKDYHIHKAGDTIKVDPKRAEWLQENGYEAIRAREGEEN
jgi:hypothetical protein